MIKTDFEESFSVNFLQKLPKFMCVLILTMNKVITMNIWFKLTILSHILSHKKGFWN